MHWGSRIRTGSRAWLRRAPATPAASRGSLAELAGLVRAAVAELRPNPPATLAGIPAANDALRMHRKASTVSTGSVSANSARPSDAGDATLLGPVPPGPASSDSDEVDADHRLTWQLVVATQNGDGEAFGKLYDRYFDSVYRFIYYRVNDRTLAEDFTSETFLRALRRIGTITYQGRDIGAWFVTIARNIVFDHSKSARNRLEITTGDRLDDGEVAPSPEGAVLDALASEHLVAAIKQLNVEQRECIELRFIQGLSVSETAAAMNKNEGAIKALQHRAVRKLSELFGGEFS